VLDSRTSSNGTGRRDATCDSRHEGAGIDTYLGYRGPLRGRAGLDECLVVIPKRAPEPMLPFARVSTRNLGERVIDRARDNARRMSLARRSSRSRAITCWEE